LTGIADLGVRLARHTSLVGTLTEPYLAHLGLFYIEHIRRVAQPFVFFLGVPRP